MILDDLLRCTGASGQDLTTTDPQVSTDYFDLTSAVRLKDYRLAVHVSAIGGTTPDLKIELFGDSATTFASEKAICSRTIATADLKAGKVYFLDIPPAAPFRYYRVKFTQSGNANNTATVACFLTPEDLVQVDVLLAGVGTP
jgi:hypothetical protein